MVNVTDIVDMSIWSVAIAAGVSVSMVEQSLTLSLISGGIIITGVVVAIFIEYRRCNS